MIDILKDCLIIVIMHRLNFSILAWQQPMVMFHLSSSSSLPNSKKSFSTHKINYWIKRCQKECLYYVYIDWLFVPNFVFHAKVSEKSLHQKYKQAFYSKKTASNSKYQSIPNHDCISIFHTEIQLPKANNGQICAAGGHYTTTYVLLWLIFLAKSS